MPRGANRKREREYEELKSRFHRSGRYRGREEEVAARIVNKQRKQYGETRREKQKDREGKSPDAGLPIRNYQHLTVPQVKKKIDELGRRDLRRVRDYENKHKHRVTLLRAIDGRLEAA